MNPRSTFIRFLNPSSVMKTAILVLFALIAFLAYRVIQLESQLNLALKNTAIAVLSAEAANDKIGAFAPYFTPDREKFVKAWLDSNNLPLAVFPDEVITPIKNGLEQKRGSKESQQLRATIFK